MSTQPKTLPDIPDWPYLEIASAICDFQVRFGRIPSTLLVGFDLWLVLQRAYESNAFNTHGIIPIYLDETGIMEGHEFIFTL